MVTIETADAENVLCDPMRELPDAFGDTVIFPGDDFTGQWPVEISPSEAGVAPTRKETGPLSHPGYVSLMLIACIDYQLAANRADHFQARYAFMLGIPMQNGTVMGDLKPEGGYPDARLIYFGQSAD